MSLKNELKFVYVIAIICLVIGVFCYSSLPAKSPEPPVRLMFKTVGGNVLFDHQAHGDVSGLACEDCHHTYKKGETDVPVSCETCHKADSKFVSALGDNGKFDHEGHSDDYGLSCNDCHHNYYEEDGGEPQPCSDCHESGVVDDYMPGRVQAFHKQCISCHEDNGAAPGQSDCESCHAPRKTVEAFHGQCIKCHEDLHKGPSGSDEDCKKCHGF